MVLQYAEANPDQLRGAIDRNSPAIVPLGALEWHGPHLPLGLDGLLAEFFGSQLCEKLEGVILPTQWRAMTTLPHEASLQISTETFRRIVEETTNGLVQAGFKTICWVSGHYAQGHMAELYLYSRSVCEKGDVRVFAASPLELLGNPALLDHAGRSETSQLSAIRPDLVQLDRLPKQIKPKVHGVLGEHPSKATPDEGHDLLTRGLEAWVEWVRMSEAQSLVVHYNKAIASYQSYVDTFFKESWEQAIVDWWATK
ncbi:MAG: creatininase family protein [Fimbriimonadaceae bacterium]|nr:creatininase family protein [Fimbriimonadaceae bacterium]